MPLVLPAHYARLREVSKMSVHRAIKSGRISTVEKDGVLYVDPDVADIEWAKNTHIGRQAQGAPQEEAKTQTRAAAARARRMAGSKNAPTAPGDAPPAADLGLGLNLRDEKTRSERVRIELLEIQLAEKRGETLNRAAAMAAWTAKLLAAGEQLQGLADRLAAPLAAETNADAVHRILSAEIVAAMSGLAGATPA